MLRQCFRFELKNKKKKGKASYYLVLETSSHLNASPAVAFKYQKLKP
jgi:hypothetical protein